MFDFKYENALNHVAERNDVAIHHIFEQMAMIAPENIAVVYKDKTLTYKQLNESANRLANWLTANYPVKADSIIGIMLERSELMMISILAVLKAGAAYLPVDPDGVAERTNTS